MTSPRLHLFIVTLLGTCALRVDAHPDVATQLATLDRRIDADHCDSAMELQRGDLLSTQGASAAALAAFDRAAACDPLSVGPDLARAHLLLTQRQPAQALTIADQALARARQPLDSDQRECRADSPPNRDTTNALLLRARAYSMLDLHEAAALDFEQAVAQLAAPQPEHYLERAQAEIAAQRSDAALAGLRQAMDRLGPVPALLRLAFDVHLERHEYETALDLLDRTRGLPGQETWWLRRADILERAGRYSDARQMYQAALDAYEARPLPRRRVPAVQQQEMQAREGVDRLANRLAQHQETP